MNTQCSFFYAKTYRFPRRLSHISRRGGNLPPAGTRSVSLKISAQRADYNYLLPLTYYFLFQLLPPAKMRSISLYFSAFTRDIIAAKPRANG